MRSKPNNVLVEQVGSNDGLFKLLKIELIVPLFLLVMSIILGVLAPSLITASVMKREVPFPPHAILWIGFTVVAISSAFWLWDELKRESKEYDKDNLIESGSWWRVLMVFVILMAGYLSAKYTGLLIAAALVHAMLLKYLSRRGNIYIVVTSILYSAFVYLVFEIFFSVRLPRSTIFPFLPF